MSKFWSEKLEKVATVDIDRQFIDIEMSIGATVKYCKNDRWGWALEVFRLHVVNNCAFYYVDRVCLTNQHLSSDMRLT